MAGRLIDSLVGPKPKAPASASLSSYFDASKGTSRKTHEQQEREMDALKKARRNRQTISTPRIGAVQRAYDAIERAAPILRPVVQGFEDLTGLRETYDAGIRGVSSALGSDIYNGQSELQLKDAELLGLTGLAGPALKGAGVVGRRGLRAIPEGAENSAKNFAVRAKDYLTEAKPLNVQMTPYADRPEVVNHLYSERIMGPRYQPGDVLPEYGYRNVSNPAEVKALLESGYMLPRDQGKGKYFTLSDRTTPSEGNRGAKPVLRVRSENIPEGRAVSADDVQLWDNATNSWVFLRNAADKFKRGGIVRKPLAVKRKKGGAK